MALIYQKGVKIAPMKNFKGQNTSLNTMPVQVSVRALFCKIARTFKQFSLVFLNQRYYAMQLNTADRSNNWRCSIKTVFVTISQNSQPNTCVRVSFSTLFKKETSTKVFSCYFFRNF